MNDQLAPAVRLAFDAFEVDLESGELWKAGRRIKLQSQPFKVLGSLLAHPGQVVTRDTLRQLIWGTQAVADLDHSLGIAINKIREALGDSADSPRYIETLSRRGYRFLAPVTTVDRPPSSHPAPAVPAHGIDEIPNPLPQPSLPELLAAPIASPPLPLAATVSTPPRSRSGNPLTFPLIALTALLLTVLVIWLWQSTNAAPKLRRVEQITHNDRIFPGAPSMESLPVLTTDGTHIFTSVLDNGHLQVFVIDIHTGELRPVPLPSELSESAVSDLSPDGTRLLLRSHRSPESEQPLWIVPTAGGSALRVGDLLAHDAIWMPDGTSILSASGNDLTLFRLKDGISTRFATLPGRGFSMRWSPSARQLRLTILDPLAHTSSLWELPASGGTPHPLLKGWSSPASECCGTWTADGAHFIFQSSHDGASDLWQVTGTGTGTPVKLTDGPLSYAAPVASRDGHALFFLGMDSHAEVERFDRSRNRFLPDRSVLAGATRVSYSRDGLWVAWTDAVGHLFRAGAADGSEKLQLTPDYLQVFLARWSPDGQSLAFMARSPGKAWHLYQVSARGGTPQLLLDEPRNAADPTWSPDGRTLAFGRTSDLMGREAGSHRIELLDLATHRVSDLPDSDGLFSPRWSPDGRWILALTLRDQKPMLFSTSTRTWQPLSVLTVADPVWAPDSQSLFAHTSFSDPQTIVRLPIVPSGPPEIIATLNNRNATEEADFVFIGITPDGSPLIRVRSETGNLYTLSLDRK